MLVKPIHTRVFNEGDDLLEFVRGYCKKLPERSVVIVTSKIVALAERRTREIINAKTKERLVKEESDWAMKTKYVWLTIRDNMVMASAGIDASNGKGKLILLPKDSFRTAEQLRRQLQKIYRVKQLGVIITDSRMIPLRLGAVGVAMGYAGFKGLKEYRGTKDIFGRKFEFERSDIADALATAAVLVMGEGAEQNPLALVTGAPIEFTDRLMRNELRIDIKEDVYQPLFERIRKIKFSKKRRS